MGDKMTFRLINDAQFTEMTAALLTAMLILNVLIIAPCALSFMNMLRSLTGSFANRM